jgi:hypothetical protein
MKFRIPTTTLPGGYVDGEIIDALKLNQIVNVLREGVNNNYDDLIKIIAGGRTVLAFNTVEDLEAAAANLGESDDGTLGIVFDYSEGDDNEVNALLIYEYDDEEEEFVEYYEDEVSFVGILDAIAEQVTNYTAIQSNATAGATHALITNGANPHATTFANITSKPTTVAGFGITDGATLVDGLIPAAQLPSYVDDVIEGVWVNSTTFTVNGTPVTGETGKIYVSTSGDETHKTFRFTGSQFVEISVSLALGNTSGTAFRGDLGEQAFNNASNANSWGNHATFGYLTNSSTRIADIQNFANNTANNVANINNTINGVSNNLSNLGNTVSDVSNLVNTINGAYLTASSTTITNLSNDISSLNNAVANKVETSTTIANLALSNNISAANLTAELPVATNSAKGLMSDTDKTNLDALHALMGSDEDDIVNKITEVLDVFEDYPEGTNIVTALGSKLDADDNRIANWDDAYSWGNHANVGYLTAESDTLDSVVNRGSVTNNATINFATTSEVIFNTTSNHGTDLGKLGWNTSDQTLQVGLGNGVVLQLGQETLYVVRNATGSTILNGTPVSCTGVTPSGRLEISPSTGTIDPVTFLGIATQDITNGVNGKVTYFGYVNGLDTRGSTASSLAVGDETWAEGDKLYVHPTVAGKLTNVEPEAPKVKICVASVIIRHQSTGVLFVRPTSNLDLTKLSDVQIATPVSGEVLAYNATAGRWENAEVVSLGLNVATSNLQNGQYLRYADGLWVNDDLVVYGSVNSVGLNMPTGFTVTNSPITNSGTLGVTYAEGYSLPTNATQDNWNSAFGWGNHQAVGYIVGLASDSVTDGNLALWNGATGKLLKDSAVALETTLTNNSSKIPTSSAVYSYLANFSSGSSVYINDTAPVSANTGDLWWNSASADLSIYYNDGDSSQWVDTTLQTANYATVEYVDEVVGDIETILDSIIGGE